MSRLHQTSCFIFEQLDQFTLLSTLKYSIRTRMAQLTCRRFLLRLVIVGGGVGGHLLFVSSEQRLDLLQSLSLGLRDEAEDEDEGGERDGRVDEEYTVETDQIGQGHEQL